MLKGRQTEAVGREDVEAWKETGHNAVASDQSGYREGCGGAGAGRVIGTGTGKPQSYPPCTWARPGPFTPKATVATQASARAQVAAVRA